jgi:uncharacterized repeat protein (TIGR03803 family)
MTSTRTNQNPLFAARLRWLASAVVLLTTIASTPTAPAQTFTVLHSFAGRPSDGRMPTAPLIQDAAGNLYGTTFGAGAFSGGTVFKVDASNNETVLHNFWAGKWGVNPSGGLVQDAAGNLYGTTRTGGDLRCNENRSFGCGTVFKLDTTGHLTVLQRFHGTDGDGPNAALLLDPVAGSLYGTTIGGGQASRGTIFRVDIATGHLTVLKSFPSSFGNPYGGVVLDAAGNLYGTTGFGGGTKCDCGTVFKLDAARDFIILFGFNGTDGSTPDGGVVLDAAGNLYGTTSAGGNSACSLGCGVVFKVDPSTLQETVLYSFTGLADGAFPAAGVIRDSDGNLYGTTRRGGKTKSAGGGFGVVFRLDTTLTETVLHTFSSKDGAQPEASLLRDRAGNLYGTTAFGGSSACKNGCGVAFKLTP